MKIDLLLLFALVGSFCSITYASTLVVPTEAELMQMTGASMSTEATVTLKDDEAAPEEAVTKASAPAATEATVEEIGATSAHTEFLMEETVATSAHTEVQTEQTDSPLAHTEAPTQETEAPLVITEALTQNPEADVEKSAATEGTPEVTEAGNKSEAPETKLPGTPNEAEPEGEADQVIETVRDKVEVEDSEGMNTGHVVGIVLGALIAVVIIIAVIVVVVRRMGQYSP